MQIKCVNITLGLSVIFCLYIHLGYKARSSLRARTRCYYFGISDVFIVPAHRKCFAKLVKVN